MTYELLKDILVPLLSALLGGLIAYVPARALAAQAARETLQREAEHRREQRLALGRQCSVKLSVAVNDVLSLKDQVDGMIQRAERNGHSDMPLSQRISILGGVERQTLVSFAADELSLFIDCGDIELIDDLTLLSRKQAALLAAFATFGTLRSEHHYLVARHGVTTRDSNGVSTTRAGLPAAMANEIAVKGEELELFTREMVTQLHTVAGFATRVAARFGKAALKLFGPGQVVVLDVSQERAG